MTDPIKTHRWKQLAKKVLAEETSCWLCGLPIDFNAEPRSTYAPSVDHVIPRSKGGDVWDRRNLRAAHYGHNSARSNRTPQPMPLSRRW